MGALLAASFLVPVPAHADNGPSVSTIVGKAHHVRYCVANDARVQVAMTIVDAKGRKRERQLSMLRWDDAGAEKQDKAAAVSCGDQRFYVYFHRPADVDKMAFLVWRNADKDDDRWLYMPALDLVKRIAAADKRTSFAGSHFYYEDVSGRPVKLDTHRLAKTTDTYYVVESKPRQADSVEFASYRSWIHKDTFVVVKVEYFDSKNQKIREYQADRVQTIDGYPTVTEMRMTDARRGEHTIVKFTSVKYDAGLPKEIFTERYLRAAPLEYLQ